MLEETLIKALKKLSGTTSLSNGYLSLFPTSLIFLMSVQIKGLNNVHWFVFIYLYILIYIVYTHTTNNSVQSQSCDYILTNDYSRTVLQTLEMSLTC